MKILFVSGNLCDGGAQRVIAVIANQLSEMGHDVTLLLFCRNLKEYYVNPKVKIHSLAKNPEEYLRLTALRRIKEIRNYLKKNTPDVAIGFLEGGYGLFVSSLGLKFTKIASARIDPTILLKKRGIRAFLDQMWFKHADAVVVQTEGQKEHALNAMWKNITVISNPIPDEALMGSTHDYTRSCSKMIMVGRLALQKNYKMAIDAFVKVRERYPNLTLDIFGKGAQETELRSLINEKGLNKEIVIKGWTQNVADEYKCHDLFILSSDFEGMPNSLMEAMAAGLPCISTNCETGPSDLIEEDENNGILVPVRDSELLADKIIGVLSMSSIERKRMGHNAYKTIQEKYNSNIIAKQWLILFDKLKKR